VLALPATVNESKSSSASAGDERSETPREVVSVRGDLRSMRRGGAVMPEILDRCVQKVMAQGNDEETAFAICNQALDLQEDEEPKDMPDDELDIRIGNEMARREFDNGPVYRKKMVVAKPIGEFVNGDQKGVMDEKRLAALARNFRKFPRQVPIFALGDHTLDLDSRPSDGWVENVRITDEGELEVDAKLHGAAVGFVVNDQIRGASIGTVQGKNPDGSAQGEVLHHVLLTNQPFIKDLNIAAARIEGALDAVCMFTTLEENEMPEDKKDQEIARLKEENAKLKKKQPPTDEKIAAQLKEQEQEIIKLKAEGLRKNTEIETLKEQLANSADKDKEAALIENENLKRDAFLRDVRQIVEYGLHKGTLLAAEVDGYAGSHPLDLQATERWLKASQFFDASQPNPEESAFQIVKHLATKTKPRVNIGARYGSGKPKEVELTLSEDEKQSIREQGLDPERIANMRDDTTYEDWRRLPKTQEK
jgi:hypothetical protein